MKKFFINTFLLIFITLFFILLYLTQFGYETKKFNKVISEKINQFNNQLLVDFNSIKLKLDLKNFSFYISTKNPEINYKDNFISFKDINVYTKVGSIIDPKIKIEKIYLDSDELRIKDLKNIISDIKPSNFKSILSNNVIDGVFKSKSELFFNDNLDLIDYQLDGYFKDLKLNFPKKIKSNNTKFIFSLGRNSGYISDLSGEFNEIKISSGDIEFLKNEKVEINSNFVANINFDEVQVRNMLKNFIPKEILDNKIEIIGSTKNILSLKLDNTLKLENYNFSSNGVINSSSIEFKDEIMYEILDETINKIQIDKTSIELKFNSSNNKSIYLIGQYQINENLFEKFTVKSDLKNSKNTTNINFDYSGLISLPIINYMKESGKKSQIYLKNDSKDKNINLNKIKFEHGNDFISIEGLQTDNQKRLKSLKKLKVLTKENDFSITLGKNLNIQGKKFDATNLSRVFTEKNDNKFLEKISKNINLKFNEVKTSKPVTLQNFVLIGNIDKGKFTKISSKGEFDENKYLDISLKVDRNNKKKYLEIYSDYPEPITDNFKFFKGLTGGKLLFNSNFDDNLSESKLIIDDFKVKNAPGFVKLLSLADLGGMADLVSGDGLRFEKLEIKFFKNNEIMKIAELYAIGPSISILMDGYIDNKTGIVSMRGTMVPAKTLNKIISKIPIVGEIVIPKEVGEGLFGVSFKMKGPPGSIKTSVNPIKTLTPRFIQKALKKN